ncbi:MAG: SEC-C metal-binding domain-containing protein [Gammaproteobacteria bacterium]|jgi:hypothetical protein
MSDAFDSLVRALREYGIGVDEPRLHGLITGTAMVPDPDLAGIQTAIVGDQPLAEVVFEAVRSSIDDVVEALGTAEYRARFDAEDVESALGWVESFLDAVRIHEQAWEELTESCVDAGMSLVMLQHLNDPAFLEGLNMDLPGPEDLIRHPQIITNAVLTMHAARREVSGDEFRLPHYSQEELAACDEPSLMAIVCADGDCLPREVIDECARRGDAIVPQLRQHLEDDANWRAGVDDEHWWALLHAILILGLIPGQTAAEALLIGFRRANFDDKGNLSDWLSSAWPALCRNKTAFTTDPLMQIAENSTAPWYPRSQAISCVLAEAEETSAEALESAIDWLAAMCANPREDPEFRVIAGHDLLDCPRERHRGVLEELVKLQRPGSLMEMAYTLDDIEHSFVSGEEPEWHRFDDPWQFYDPLQIIGRQERWRREDERLQDAFDDEYPDDSEPFVRSHRKIGRNEPCPCGSGLKYKKCCM